MPEATRHRLIDYHDLLGAVVPVRRLEDAAFERADAHRLEVAFVHYVPVVDVFGRPVRGPLIVFDIGVVCVYRAQRGEPRDKRSGLDSGQRGQSLLELIGKTQSIRGLISRSGKLEIERRNPAWFESDLDLSKLPEGANHETRPDHRNHGECYLRDHKRLSQSVTSATARGSLSRASQRSCEIAVAHLKKRRHREDDDRENRDT